ncbi:MAG: hypothetical protein ACOY0T_00885 [Myxococcota bacterium]
MVKLSQKSQWLIRTGRRAYRPSKADRERIFSALQARLGEAAMLMGFAIRYPRRQGGLH